MNGKLKYLTLFVMGMMLSLGINAQSVKSISGTVTDDQGEAVISGTVKVKNGSTGTITDVNGKMHPLCSFQCYLGIFVHWLYYTRI